MAIPARLDARIIKRYIEEQKKKKSPAGNLRDGSAGFPYSGTGEIGGHT